ncbi:cAMP-binding domain of CRP or a regulatory subunit of cAMP-dependent protein kinases [Amycolatopsis xylanica]|uniref:cAMP-binding domain of CRP or a regulatory subunit of cAMP-dependent protein kinases n=1 Tax=Amycolatopsis xylanica TaxID=589385 RepID=A0A1H3DCJ5_9PSEU|nr:Crp/Fnr family transcriptional regulator [Amycolatopsis xylanica]SDX64096.1 cAMP-binding domain of CRP or a regulatory subunit of cAMP-dependent protein kinases [Amycolatopsis xylanica]
MGGLLEPAAGSLVTYLSPEDRRFLLGLGSRRRHPRGELLLRQGDPTGHLLLITEGWVKISSSIPGGLELLTGLRGPGHLIGELAALYGAPRGADVHTVETVELVVITRERFLACLLDRPAITIALVKQMADRVSEAENMRRWFAMHDVTKRIAASLLHLAQQHGVEGPAGLVIRIPLTQQDLANHVGATRRSVARAMTALRERGLITAANRRHVVPSLEELRAFLEESPNGVAPV